MLMDEVDVISQEQHPLETTTTTIINDNYDDLIVRLPDPITIRGSGHVTVFALNNKFDDEYPQQLTARVARDEYSETIKRVNTILRKNVPINFKWLLCGCICCCCTIGLSMCPVFCLNKRSKHAVNKILEWENQRLYHILGLHWKLDKQKCQNNAVQEYVLMIEFRPKSTLIRPD
ncbi:unnamed protein product [Didymodactylos carnosus]|uniref:Golgin subfamily A member 7/ERF4 domain-containing protein n=1 Tax=Didymodactylos carnosus TaxID=1234261 RepID=A0A814TX03_9BILA|nr:unnamed protein product [Didymodactylos carnosus]CAF1165918.1 unnamed protein product [Didymodactylos carnosus]CAF3743423.1 unnamed protein product [Didymodactylos carnosus]CAF3929572.1 unnamed protein product [Didymodactylos carnosus]